MPLTCARVGARAVGRCWTRSAAARARAIVGRQARSSAVRSATNPDPSPVCMKRRFVGSTLRPGHIRAGNSGLGGGRNSGAVLEGPWKPLGGMEALGSTWTTLRKRLKALRRPRGALWASLATFGKSWKALGSPCSVSGRPRKAMDALETILDALEKGVGRSWKVLRTLGSPPLESLGSESLGTHRGTP